LPRWIFALTAFASLVLFTFGIAGCAGGASSASTQASSPGTATPQNGATVINNVQEGKWQTCGACGDTGGTGPLATYSFTTGISSPSQDGEATQFSISAAVAFSNAFFFQVQTPVTGQLNSLTYAFDLYIPPGMESAPQAIEFQCQQKLDGWIYNFAWQADYNSNEWRIFNYVTQQWDDSGLPLQRFTPGVWHHIMGQYHDDITGHFVYHDSLTIDGILNPVNIQHDAVFTGANNQFANAIQLDSNSVPAAYNIFVDEMTITYQ
jgi:hypothetical protein